MPLSSEKKQLIFIGWQHSVPPIQLAKQLRLVPLTVIAEYVRLDRIPNQ